MDTLSSTDALVDALLTRVGRRLRVATPLGLGKPNHLLNALYRRAKADRSIELSLYTALTLQRPVADRMSPPPTPSRPAAPPATVGALELF